MPSLPNDDLDENIQDAAAPTTSTDNALSLLEDVQSRLTTIEALAYAAVTFSDVPPRRREPDEPHDRSLSRLLTFVDWMYREIEKLLEDVEGAVTRIYAARRGEASSSSA